MDGFVTAVSVRTGKKQAIPAEWLEHPVLSLAWRLPPSAGADTDVVDEHPPGDGSTAAPTDATPGDPNTPAAGGEQEY